MKYTLLQEFRRQNGKNKGLFFGIVWSDGGTKWYELALVMTSPAMILVTPMTVKSYYGNVNSAFGTFWMPHLLPLNLNG